MKAVPGFGIQFGRLRLLALSLTFWTAVAFAASVPTVGVRQPWRRTFVSALATWWAWSVLTVPIVLLDRRLARSHWKLWQRLLVHVPVALTFIVLEEFLSTVFRGSIASVDMGSNLHHADSYEYLSRVFLVRRL